MTTVRPWWARFVGLLWMVAGAVLFAAGLVVVVDQHDVLRWEFVAAAVVALVGWQAWSRAVVVDAHGMEDRAGRHRQRLLWGTVDRVAVGSDDRAAGPVTVWRAGSDDPVVLRGSWGTSRSQRIELAKALRRLVEPFGITVTADVDADLDRDGTGSGATADHPPSGTEDATWTARGPAEH